METAYFWALALGGTGVALCLIAAVTAIMGAVHRTSYEALPRYTGRSVLMLVAGCVLLVASLVVMAVNAT